MSVTITGPDAEWLAEHARALVTDRLAACGNVIPGVRSIYRWAGAVADDAEAILVLHTTDQRLAAVIERTNAAHPYDTVQIVATVADAVDPAYERWVIDSTGHDTD